VNCYIIIDESNQGQRLDKVLSWEFPDYSRTYFIKAIKKALVKVDGQEVKPAELTKIGQTIIFTPERSENSTPAIDIPIDIIYRDKDYLVINKQPGLIIHPAQNVIDRTLAEALVAREPELAEVGEAGRSGIVHRLDSDTSGVMVVARNEQAWHHLKDAFAKRDVQKKYLAFTRGRPSREGLLETNYGRHPTRRHKMAVLKVGRQARTVVKILKYFPLAEVSLVELSLLTGRTHQARVHLAHLGSPVLGDRRYGLLNRELCSDNPAAQSLIQRQLLHARRLVFPRLDGTLACFRAPWPADFIALWRELNSQEKLSGLKS
jgi:23S rRNA pseudouridine1911/1915/1917 synthase